MIALTAAMAGGAVAQEANIRAKPVTKKRAKQIAKKQANKQITKRAPGLSVARADTAGSADTADTADSAGNADRLDGIDGASFNYTSNASATETTLLNLHGLQIVASCPSQDLSVIARTTVDNAMINTGAFDSGGADEVENENADDNFDVGENFDVLDSDDDLVNGTLEYTTPNGPPVSVTYQAGNPYTGANVRCAFTGHALGG